MKRCTASTSIRAGSSSSSNPSARALRATSVLQHGAKLLQRLLNMPLVDDERRQEADRGRAGGVQDEVLLKQRATHDLRCGYIQLAGEHQAAPAHGEHVRQLLQPSREEPAQLANTREQRGVLDDVERRER